MPVDRWAQTQHLGLFVCLGGGGQQGSASKSIFSSYCSRGFEAIPTANCHPHRRRRDFCTLKKKNWHCCFQCSPAIFHARGRWEIERNSRSPENASSSFPFLNPQSALTSRHRVMLQQQLHEQSLRGKVAAPTRWTQSPLGAFVPPQGLQTQGHSEAPPGG